MILQALHQYYERKVAHPGAGRRLAAIGLEDKEIAFILELTPEGRLAGVSDTRSGDGKRKTATRYLVPQGVKKTSGIAANLLWDNAEYLLAVPDQKKLALAREKGSEGEYLARLREMQAAFKTRIEALPAQTQHDDRVRAVMAFLNGDAAGAVRSHAAWADIAVSNPTLSLRLEDDDDLVCQRPAVAQACLAHAGSAAITGEADNEGATAALASSVCLVTGDVGPPARLHTAIKGVWGAQTSGANIVSFNRDAFSSFAKAQGANAPVSRRAAFAYTTALNYLLDKGSRQRVQVGDAATVFWAQKDEDADVEAWFADAFGSADDPDARTERIRALFGSVAGGRFDGARGGDRFYVLGLAPNTARIAVRFWHAATIAEIGQRIRLWFDDLRIARGPNEPEYPWMRRLLEATAVLGKPDNIAPQLAGDLMRSALDGTPLPKPLLQAVVQRCRADQSRKTDSGTPVPHVSHARAALMKASLNRLIRQRQLDGKEIAVSLDPDNTEPAYLAGRLFSAYERVQSDAAERELNRSIRDSYFGAAMSNPATVFSRLIQLNQHHMRDLKRSKPGLHVMRDRLIGGIWDKLAADSPLPLTLPLAERARFALGYYHQRQAFFVKSDAAAAPKQPAPSEGEKQS